MKKLRLSYGSRSLYFTRFGTWTIAAALALGVAAINSGSNLLYLVVAMMLSMMLISGILSEQTLRRLNIKRLLPAEVFAGEPFPVRFQVVNGKKKIPSYALTVSDFYEGGGRGPSSFVLRVPPDAVAGSETEAVVPSRGLWEIAGHEVSTLFPFGLFRKSVRVRNNEVKLVYPRLAPLDEGLVEELAGELGGGSRPRRGEGPGVRGIRAYVAGEEARRIHWKASARLMSLMAREPESEEAREVCVLLDNVEPLQPPEGYAERFEEAVSLAASVIYLLAVELERPVSLLTAGGLLPSGSGRAHFIRLMEELAMLAPVRASEAVPATPDGDAVIIAPGYLSRWASESAAEGVLLEAGA